MSTSTMISSKQQWRALGLSTAAFTLCFAAWTLFSILGIAIKQEMNLSDTQLGLLVATPVLTGAVSRLFLGVAADRFGGRWIFGLLMLFSAASIFLLSLATSYYLILAAALGVGLAGGSFIVGVTYTSAWFEPGRQGTALGILGAGNVGSAITNFGAPFLLLTFGWQQTALIYAFVLASAGVAFIAFAKPEPGISKGQQADLSLGKQLAPLVELRVWRFSLYYFFVFGAFVALALWLPHYLMEVYGLGVAAAGVLTVLFTLPGSLFRIAGGWMSDKYGARRVMYWSFIVAVICTFILSYPPTRYVVRGVEGEIRFSFEINLITFSVLIFILGAFMSLGMAAVFKHIPVYYPKHVGAVGGAVGMIGALGGFLLPITFGMLSDVVGIWQSSFMLLFIISTSALVWMHYAIRQAEQREWAGGREETDLPELATPDAFVLEDWHPEDAAFWSSHGRRIARKNLWISIPCLFLAFAVWTIWSILVVEMPELGFPYTRNQLFWLAALPALSGATLRIFYSFMVPVFGGRRWTAMSTASLLLPCLWMGVVLQNPDTSYLVMLILALLCGLGGGNFASSMANISFFFPKTEKGGALGLNAGLGNLGVSAMQLIAPLVISAGVLGPFGGESLPDQSSRPVWLQNAALVWVPFIVAAAVFAWFGMNDIASARSSFRDQAIIFRRKHNWLMCWLYLGTFGSFIGFAAGFPLLSGMLFPQAPVTYYAFLGPLLGALARPVGGMLADRLGGARVTLWNFFVMVLGVVGIMVFLPGESGGGSFAGFFGMFLLLFIATGIGNGSTYRMVPVMFLTLRQRELGRDNPRALLEGNRESAAVLGFISAIGAYGGFFIPKAYGTSFDLTGGIYAALMVFILFYASCIAITWWYYARRNAPLPC